MKSSDKQRLQKILENAEKLVNYIREHNVGKDDLLNDYSLQWLVTTPLYNIGEHVYNLSSEYKNSHKDIPWLMIFLSKRLNNLLYISECQYHL